MRTAALLVLVLGAQEIPDHPDKLVYAPLRFEVPDPASMRVELKGGAKAYLIEDAALPLVDVQVFVKAGSFGDPPGREGLADLCAGLMRTGGTTTLGPEDLDRELDELAANLSVSLGDVYGVASLSILAKDLDRGLELLMDVLRNPAFRQDKLDVLKAQTLDALRARNDSTAGIESREANLLLYGDFPLNRLPTRSSVEAVSRVDLARFHRASFHPSRFIIAAAGAFKRDALAAKLEAAFKDWPPSDGKPPEVPPPGKAAEPAIYCFHKDGKNINQGRVTIGHLGLTIDHPDVQAVRVMSYILGAGGFSSRLMQRVRTEEGLAYSVHSDLRPGYVYPFPFKLQFQSKSASVARAAKLCLEELERLREEGVSEKELKAAQQFFLDAFPGLFFASRIQTASTYAQAELLGLPKDYYATYREKIAALTPADIRRVAREHLKPEKFVWVVVGDIPAIKKGDGRVALSDLGKIVDVPLPDPLTLERPR